MEYWGQHLLIDGITADIEKVKDKKNISDFVSQLVVDIDMVSYGPLWIERFATHDPEKAGISFIQMIETSNITGHFVDKDGSFYLDVFSCKDFSVTKVIELVNEFFGSESKNLRIRNVSRQAPKI